MEAPSSEHWSAVKHLLRYIAGTRTLGCCYARQGSKAELVGYSDADMAGDVDDRKSTSGVLFFFGQCPITWQSTKQKIVVLSSYEAEYVAATAAACQGVWLKRLHGELPGHDGVATELRVDNKSVIALMKNPVFHDRSKHIHTRYHFIRQCVDNGDIDIQFVRTEDQLSDIMTKALGRVQFQELRRRIGIIKIFQAFLVFATIVAQNQWTSVSGMYCEDLTASVYRPHSVSITEFGAVGDGITPNTKAFQNAIFYLTSFANKGGAQLFVPAGRWLTGSFSLISHLTVSLDKDAVIIGSPDSSDWPIIDRLPSYGRGRELPGKRHQSLIFGSNLTDVIISGANGTIDGQGAIWWNWFHNQILNYTRPPLVELMYSTRVVISNLTFTNSPFWNIHPVYCSQVLIQHLTILAPISSPNTDGIDPDSSTNVCIEDCYIRNGDDIVVIKSGWDQYGISFAHPSSNISICNITGETRSSAGIALGSEMSGGISEVRAEGIHIINSVHGIRIKTAPGRGGYVKNVYIADVSMDNVSIAIRVTGNYGEHPDDKYDKYALPIISNITIKDVVGVNIGVAGMFQGIQGDSFSNICLSNVTLSAKSTNPWNCSLVEGYSNSVSPEICEQLRSNPGPGQVCYDGSNYLTPGAVQPHAPQKASASRLLNPFHRLASL